MTVQEITPTVDKDALLTGAQFADAFRIEVTDPAIDARHAAERMMAHQPQWAEALVRLRNILVTPFGLKPSGDGAPAPRGMIGIFPVLSETPDRLIAGFNDSHLDFRVVVDVAPSGPARSVTLTTVVLTHNLFGRAYLAVIMPFHRLIAPALLRQVAG